jgi:hypothetical protein
MKFILSLLASAVWFGWSITAAETNRPLTQFREANFGVSFSHSEDVTTEYDPHGKANQVAMSRKGTPIGGLKILRPFPTTNDTEFVESAKKHYKETLGASSVEHRFYENPQKYKFHVFKAKLERNGTNYITERFAYHCRRVSKNPDQAMLDRMFGVFQFEFIAPASDYLTLELEIKTVIDTFRLKEDP